MHPLWGDPGRLVLPEMYKRPHCFFTPSHYLEMGDTRERWGGKSPYTPMGILESVIQAEVVKAAASC